MGMVGRVVVIRYSLFVYPFSGSLRQVLRKVEVKGSPALGISSSFGKVPNSQFQVPNRKRNRIKEQIGHSLHK